MCEQVHAPLIKGIYVYIPTFTGSYRSDIFSLKAFIVSFRPSELYAVGTAMEVILEVEGYYNFYN